mmetsp:Transcript_16605/g.26990  ORF Transcript_16605/g.26990 Transcript_16605/m.26990 type:complete len:466 (+) Transcript_16605:74-1471(+)
MSFLSSFPPQGQLRDGSSSSSPSSSSNMILRFFCSCQPGSVVGRQLAGDKIILPAGLLNALMVKFRMMRESLPNPIVLEIRNKTRRRISHCGILEFTSPQEGVAFLPDWMLLNLRIKPGETTQFTLRPIPKLTFVKLQPLRSNFGREVKNPEAELTSALEKFTCLTAGDAIEITIRDTVYCFRIREVEPDRGKIPLPGYCSYRWQQMEGGSNKEAKRGNASSITDNTNEKQQPSEKRSNLPNAGCIVDADIKVEFMAPVYPDDSGNADNHNTDVKKAAIERGGRRGRTTPLSNRIGGQTIGATTVSNVAQAKGKMCPICRKDIPTQRFTLHSMQCARLNVWCEKCQAVIKRSEFQEHMDKFHKMVKCSACNMSMESGQLEEHAKSACPHRLVTCKWCGVQIEYISKGDHQRICGAKTIACRICGISLSRRAMDRHMAAVHRIDPSLMTQSQDYSEPVPADSVAFH